MVKLTQKQEKVFRMLTEEFLTPKQIIQRLGDRHNGVYRIIRELKKKGFLDQNLRNVQRLQTRGGHPNQNVQNVQKTMRLHAERFSIQILEKGIFYEKFLKRQNKTIIDTNTIMMYKNNLVVYSNRDFWGDDVEEILSMSSKYWNNFITILENHFRITLRKQRKTIINHFGGHIAFPNNDIAKRYNSEKVKLKILDEKDGKIRVLIDDSFNLNELEAVHKEHYSKDAKNIDKHIKSMLNPETPTNSEIFREMRLYMLKNEKDKNEAIEMNKQNIERDQEILLMIKGLTMEIAKLKHKE